MRPVNRGDWPSRKTDRGTTANVIYKEYGSIRIDLIGRIGEYCSYCEVPLGVNLAIEHMLSKVFSLNDIDWNNSLLACTNCNSRKKDQLGSEAALQNYFWPQTVDSNKGLNTFDLLRYRRATLNLKTDIVDKGLLVLPQARANKPYVTNQYDAVWVEVNPNYAASPESDKIKRTITLTGLNDYVPDDGDPKASDRRVANRTAAWGRAVTAADALAKYFAPHNQTAVQNPNKAATDAAADPKIRLLKRQIAMTAVATGFWSVWVTVFKDTSRTFLDDATRTQLIRELFVNTFPGTVY